MTRSPSDDVKDVPLPTDNELVPHLQMLLEDALRRQLWVMLLDRRHRPLPVLIPEDLPAEAEDDNIEGFRDFFSCLALDVPGCTLVLAFERPGPEHVTKRDRRWLRVLREAAVASGFPFRGPYLLLGSQVRAVPPDDYLAEPYLDPDA